MTPRLLLFDIDGTLLQGSTAVHRDAFAYVFRTIYNLPITLDGIIAAGRTDLWLLVEALRRTGLAEEHILAHAGQAFTAMEEYVERHITDLRGNVLPGAHEVLDQLERRGVTLGLLTGNVGGIARAKMRQAGLERYFSTGAFGEESVERSDLVPIALAHARSVSGFPFSSCDAALIGDTPLDIAAGAAHGTWTCGVATGRFSMETLQSAGADLVLPSFRDTDKAVECLLALGC